VASILVSLSRRGTEIISIRPLDKVEIFVIMFSGFDRIKCRSFLFEPVARRGPMKAKRKK
jgi:hypothetical protein